PLVHRGNRMASGERDELLALDPKERIGAHEQGAGPALDESGKCDVDFVFGAGIDDHDCLPDRTGNLPHFRHLNFGNLAAWVHQKGDCSRVGDHLAQQLQALGAERGGKACTPVALPSGRSKRLTRPSATGSLPLVKTSGIVDVAAKTARAGWPPPVVTITAARRSTSSFANAGKRS